MNAVSQLASSTALLSMLELDASPDQVALLVGDRRISRGELRAQAERLARQIDSTTAPGSRIALVDHPDENTIVALLASIHAQRPVAMIPVTGIDDPDVHRLAAEASCPVIVHRGVLRETQSNAAPLDAGPARQEERKSPEAVVLYTSGTTSGPRGVRLSVANIASNVTAVRRTIASWHHHDVLGQVLPVTHSFGLSMMLLALSQHVPVALLSGELPSRRLARQLEQHGVTLFACVPYYARLLQRRGVDLGGADVPRIRALYLAGGGISDEDLARVLPSLRADVHVLYGFTEASARVAVRRVGDGAPANSVGLPLPGVHVDIVDEAGVALPHGCEGTIRVWSPGLMLSYLGEPDRDRAEPFATTDLGYLDDAGNLFVTGRQAEMLNFRGNRLSVVNLEATLLKLDGVADARVQPESGAEDATCSVLLVTQPDADQSTVRREAVRRMPPGLVRAVEFVEALATTRSGKALRRL